jgi:hypothetical protein
MAPIMSLTSSPSLARTSRFVGGCFISRVDAALLFAGYFLSDASEMTQMTQLCLPLCRLLCRLFVAFSREMRSLSWLLWQLLRR